MDERRWMNANVLVEAIRKAERAAGEVASDYFYENRRFRDVSHPSEDEANDIKRQLSELRKVAAGIAGREGAS